MKRENLELLMQSSPLPMALNYLYKEGKQGQAFVSVGLKSGEKLNITEVKAVSEGWVIMVDDASRIVQVRISEIEFTSHVEKPS